MKARQRATLAIIVGLFAFAGVVHAHHGTNISYDHNKPTTLTGTLREFVWGNPHCQLYFDVTDASGKVTKWSGELNSPSVLGRQGWTKRLLKAGDVITLTVFPSKAGASAGVVDRTRPILANGKEVVAARAQNVD